MCGGGCRGGCGDVGVGDVGVRDGCVEQEGVVTG